MPIGIYLVFSRENREQTCRSESTLFLVERTERYVVLPCQGQNIMAGVKIDRKSLCHILRVHPPCLEKRFSLTICHSCVKSEQAIYRLVLPYDVDRLAAQLSQESGAWQGKRCIQLILIPHITG